MEHKCISTDKAPAALGPYSQAVVAGDFVFVSGAIPIDMSTGELSTGDIKDQTRICMNNLSTILEAAGSSLEKVVKTTIFLSDLSNFGNVNEAYGEFFKSNPPARACVQVAALPKNSQIEIEVIATL